MNVINLYVNFEKRQMKFEGVSVVAGDYNSTKLVFTFDKEYTETKICKIAKRINRKGNNDAIFVSEIIDNEVVLATENEDHELVSIFDEAGKYVLELALYGNNSKLTSMYTGFTVSPEMIRIGDTEVTSYLPIFDQLMNDATTLINNLSGAIREEQTRQSNETTRQGNETLRGQAEEARVRAEQAREALKQEIERKLNNGEFNGQDGQDGQDGITPTIGANSNWYFNGIDTGLPSRGEKGDKGDTGNSGLVAFQVRNGRLIAISEDDDNYRRFQIKNKHMYLIIREE